MVGTNESIHLSILSKQLRRSCILALLNTLVFALAYDHWVGKGCGQHV